MRPFRFRLQRVLDLSGQVVKAREVELAAALHREREAVGRLEDVRAVRQSGLAALAGRQRRGMSPWEWAAFAAYLTRLRKTAEQLAAELSRCQAETEARRAELLGARRERKTLETLRRKAWEGYRQEVGREERKLLDDLGVDRFVRHTANR